MAKNRLPTLPLEVLCYIITFLPPSQLASVILACQTFRRFAEPLLYRHIALSNCPTRCFYLLRTLLSREELCKLIQSFHPADRYKMSEQHSNFPLARRIFGDRLGSAHQKAYYRHTDWILERLCNAESISIPGFVVSTEKIINFLPRFRQIKKFRSHGDIGELGVLLDLLPSVTHLELPFYSFELSVGQVQAHHVRDLEALFCPPYMAISLVPSRPIKQLALFWCSSPFALHGLSTQRLMEVMGQGTAVIKSLGLFFGVYANMPDEIGDIFCATAKFLPDVEELTIWVNFWKPNPLGLTRTLRDLCESLPSFHKLRSIDFNGSNDEDSDLVPYFDRRRNAISAVHTEILEVWSELCPTLERVTFPNGAIWIKEPVVSPPTHRRRPLSLFRRTFFSVNPLPINPTPQEATGLPDQGHSSERNPAFDNVANPEVDISASIANINLTAEPSSPHAAHHNPDLNNCTGTTTYKWRCLNPYQPHLNRASLWFNIRLQKSELGWGTPMFERDLKARWPEGLPIQTP